jgi:hypothetical protein
LFVGTFLTWFIWQWVFHALHALWEDMAIVNMITSSLL